MSLPRMPITGTTATGDIITGPGVPVVLVKGLPTATLTSVVTGTVCVGVISGTSSVNVMACGLPIATITSTVTGVNPITGIPITTVCLASPNVNVM